MPLSPEELSQIVSQVSEALKPTFNDNLNAAITSHNKRLEKNFEEKLAAAIKVQEPAPVKTETVPQVDPKKISPEAAALQATVEELKKNFEKEQNARIAAETKARDDSAFNLLKSSLKGVKPELQDAAAQLLFHVQKRVTFDDKGQPLFRMTREVAGVQEDVDLPLSSGIEHWQKSPEAKPFLPAPGATEQGGRGGRAPNVGIPSARARNGMPIYDKPATTDAEKVARALEMSEALKNMGVAIP